MKHWLLALSLAVCSLPLLPLDAEAKRLGGGGSAGMKRDMPARTAPDAPPPKPAQGSTAAPANAAQPINTVTINAGGAVTLPGGTLQNQVPQGPGKVTTTNERQTRDNRFTDTARPEPTLADKQTARDVERLFGRPLRMAGASLADQRVATQLIPSRSLDAILADTNGEVARKDREALAKIADVALEVLISSRQLVIREVSGDKVYQVPDIQVSAIRLKDAAILGQASASDILGRDRYAGRIITNFDVREITEAVALALMEDMALTVK